jgi:hypothetical protein
VATSAYTTFRAALQATLAAGITADAWNAGPPPSGAAVPDSTALGYVWVEQAEQDNDNKLLERITCGVRIYPIWTQRLDPQTPIDPTVLEQAAEDLQTVLAPAQAPGDPWFYEVLSIKFEHDAGYVEAAVQGTRWNDFAIS